MRHENVVLCCLDKGVGIVIMNRKAYIEKLLANVTGTNEFISVSNEKDKTNHSDQQLTIILKAA